MDYRLARGLLVATALGDALGLPLEIMEAPPRDEWLRDINSLKPIMYDGTILFSDDTETMLILAETIVESCGFNPRLFVEKLTRKARTWDPIRNYNEGLAEVIEAVRRGRDWRIAARLAWGGQGNFGNNAAVRSPPILVFYETRYSVETMSVAQAMVTHVHPIGLEAARLYAIALYELLHGADIASLPRMLARETIDDAIREKLELIGELLDASPTKVAKILGNGSAAHESLAAALYAAIRGDGRVRDSLLYALSLGGDADGIAAMAATLAAASSPEALEEDRDVARLASRLEKLAELESLARGIISRRELCSATPY